MVHPGERRMLPRRVISAPGCLAAERLPGGGFQLAQVPASHFLGVSYGFPSTSKNQRNSGGVETTRQLCDAKGFKTSDNFGILSQQLSLSSVQAPAAHEDYDIVMRHGEVVELGKYDEFQNAVLPF